MTTTQRMEEEENQIFIPVKNGGFASSAPIPEVDKMNRLVLGLHTLSHLRVRGYFFVLSIFALLGCVGVFFGLLVVNFQKQEFIEEHYYKALHLLSFWAVFVFAVVEAFVLTLSNLVNGSKLQISLLRFNIVTTLLTAIFFTIYPEFYEVPAHYAGSFIQIFITSVNFVFILNAIRMKDRTDHVFYEYRRIELSVASLVLLLSIFRLLFSSDAIPTPSPERIGHFCEFINEILNGLFALWYAWVIYGDNQREHEEYKESLRQYF